MHPPNPRFVPPPPDRSGFDANGSPIPPLDAVDAFPESEPGKWPSSKPPTSRAPAHVSPIGREHREAMARRDERRLLVAIVAVGCVAVGWLMYLTGAFA
jgi:hypothetical protein